jgi:hypothetical protein
MTDSIEIIGSVTTQNEWAEGTAFAATVTRDLASRIIKAALAVRENKAYSMEMWDAVRVFDKMWIKTADQQFATFADTDGWPILVADIPKPTADKLLRLKALTDDEMAEDEEENSIHLPRTEEAKQLREDPEVQEYLHRFEIHYDEGITAQSFDDLEAMRTSCDCIVVLDDGFYWSAYEKDGPGQYETARSNFEILEPLLDEPIPEVLKSKLGNVPA